MDWENMQVTDIETSLRDKIVVLKISENFHERPMVEYYFSNVAAPHSTILLK